MAARCLRAQWLRTSSTRRPTTRRQSSFAHLREELLKREIQPTFEDVTPLTSYRLEMTLADWLPDTRPPSLFPDAGYPLLIPNHLCYFEPAKPQSAMLPDGTNPDQSPGEPFVRRMWAGGRVNYNPRDQLLLDGSRGVCAEFIRGVDIKGPPGEEKVFVSVERRLAKATEREMSGLAVINQNATITRSTKSAPLEGSGLTLASMDSMRKYSKAQEIEFGKELTHLVRQRLWRPTEDDFGEACIVETRNIVFLRARTPKQVAADAARSASGAKRLVPQHTPSWTHTIVPDAKLLFRFSALTFNAHAIHLDPQYAREVEGHRNLLFHGPLSFVFLMTLLRHQLESERRMEQIMSVEYRNLAPLYCGEKVKFCGVRTGERKWEVWAETPDGGVAVKGTVITGMVGRHEAEEERKLEAESDDAI